MFLPKLDTWEIDIHLNKFKNIHIFSGNKLGFFTRD